MKSLFRIFATLLLFLIAPSTYAQINNGQRSTVPASARAAAPVDLTGYWVTVITEDWRLRMVTPSKGDVSNIPVNAEARRVADAWNPDADSAAGNQCKYYAAPLIMRLPGRFHITWQDDNTLRVDTDNGQQTRLLHFNGTPEPTAEPT